MRFPFFLIIGCLFISSCIQNDADLVDTEQTPIEDASSPFEALMGTWQVESVVYGQDTTLSTSTPDILHIEEDAQLADRFARGYMQRGDDPNSRDHLTIELPIGTQDSIIMVFERNFPGVFYCNYTLHNEDHLEIDDSTESQVIWTHIIAASIIKMVS